MIAAWWSAGRRALAGRTGWAGLVLALSMVRLLTDLGLGSAVATRAYLLTLTLLGCLWCGRRLVVAISAEHPQNARRQRPVPGRPPRLISLEESVGWAVRSEHVRDTRLRPDVRYAVADRLGRAGYFLGSHPAADELLGPATAAFVASESIAEPGTGRRGFDQHQLQALVDELAGLEGRIATYREPSDVPRRSPYETRETH